jgi:hypothetical protein
LLAGNFRSRGFAFCARREPQHSQSIAEWLRFYGTGTTSSQLCEALLSRCFRFADSLPQKFRPNLPQSCYMELLPRVLHIQHLA